MSLRFGIAGRASGSPSEPAAGSVAQAMSVQEGIVATARETALPRVGGFSWPLLLAVAGFLVVAARGIGLTDQDVYLHVAVGRWIVEHGYVPAHDPFSFTMRGAPWVVQEWGSDLLAVLAYRIAGWSGLVFLGAASFGAALGYLMRFLSKRMEPLHALVLGCLAAGMMLPYLVDRPHEFVWPLTVIWIGGLVRASEENRAPSWWLLGVMLLWANMHASFILGLILMIPLALDSLENGKGRWSKVARRWAPFCAAAVAISLLNPQGYRLLIFPFHILAIKQIMLYFKDWRPPALQHLQPLDFWLIAVVGAAFAGRVRLSLARAAVVFGLLYMALEHFRHVALLGMISPFFLASPVAAGWRSSHAGNDDNALDRWFRALSRPARHASVWMTLPVACAAAVIALHAGAPRPAVPGILAPRPALDAILSKVPRPRIFNDVNFGDYLIFRGVPVFVDARAGMYGEAFLKKTFDAVAAAPDGDIQALLTKYRINAILLWPGLSVVPLINRMPGWRRVYEDRWAVAYVRRGAHVK